MKTITFTLLALLSFSYYIFKKPSSISNIKRIGQKVDVVARTVTEQGKALTDTLRTVMVSK